MSVRSEGLKSSEKQTMSYFTNIKNNIIIFYLMCSQLNEMIREKLMRRGVENTLKLGHVNSKNTPR